MLCAVLVDMGWERVVFGDQTGDCIEGSQPLLPYQCDSSLPDRSATPLSLAKVG